MKRTFESEEYRLITDQLFQSERDGFARVCTRVPIDLFQVCIERLAGTRAIPSRDRRQNCRGRQQ